MGKQLYLNRYSLIIKRLETGPATYKQIEDYLMNAAALEDSEVFTYTIRTLQRDIIDIYRFFNIEIVNERKGDKRYLIRGQAEMEMYEYNQTLLESYQVLKAINQYPDFAKYIFPEARKPRGVNHFYPLLQAIRNRNVLCFSHFKFGQTTESERKVYPLALKESKGRWYLVAVDTKDRKLKTFGLDRIGNIHIQKSTYPKRDLPDVMAYFKNAFGIISSENMKVEEVLIASNREQADYIKSFPLHTSQTVVTENRRQVTFKLKVGITYDLIQELLSYGNNIEVLAPARLRQKMQSIIKEMLVLYK
jgi:proteasome accessory factor B